MGENVRRVRLLLVVGAAALLAFLAAWPSPGAATETEPLYLARELGAGRSAPTSNQFVAVATAPGLLEHLFSDTEQIADLEVVDSAGRVVVFQADGQVTPTGQVLDPAAVRSWLQSSFAVRARAVNAKVSGDASNKVCAQAKRSALSRLSLPTHEGTRELTLAETLVEADRRIAAMHQPVNQIPSQCFLAGQPDHRAGYLHNLWHRITGS